MNHKKEHDKAENGKATSGKPRKIRGSENLKKNVTSENIYYTIKRIMAKRKMEKPENHAKFRNSKIEKKTYSYFTSQNKPENIFFTK